MLKSSLKRLLCRALSLSAVLACTAGAGAQEPRGVPREIIPGSELMSSQEREQYRQRMRGARTPQEQAGMREEHVKRMRERARLRGLQLAEPQAGKAP